MPTSALHRISTLTPLVLGLLCASAPASAGGPIASGETLAGTITAQAFSESWAFTGTTNDRVVIAAANTSGTPNTRIRLYPPTGGAAVVNTPSDRADYQLLETGTYTIVVEEDNFGTTGGYDVGLLNATSGPFTSGIDPDGGAIASA